MVRMLSKKELYDFAGVDYNCSFEELEFAVEKKLSKFLPKTEDDLDFKDSIVQTMVFKKHRDNENKMNVLKMKQQQEFDKLTREQEDKIREISKLSEKRKINEQQEVYKQFTEHEIMEAQIQGDIFNEEFLNAHKTDKKRTELDEEDNIVEIIGNQIKDESTVDDIDSSKESKKFGLDDEYFEDTVKIFKNRTSKSEESKEEVKDTSIKNLKLSKKVKKYIALGLSFAIVTGGVTACIIDDGDELSEEPIVLTSEEADYEDDKVFNVEEVYTVVEGDNLYDLSLDKNVDVEDIRYEDNRKIDPYYLMPGDRLIINHKVKGSILEDCVVPVDYKPNVVNYSGFADMFNTTKDTIFKLNKGSVTLSMEDGSYVVLADELYVPNFNDILKQENNNIKSK